MPCVPHTELCFSGTGVGYDMEEERGGKVSLLACMFPGLGRFVKRLFSCRVHACTRARVHTHTHTHTHIPEVVFSLLKCLYWLVLYMVLSLGMQPFTPCWGHLPIWVGPEFLAFSHEDTQEPFVLGAHGGPLLLFSCSVVSDSCDPMDCSPPNSSVLGIFQARILEWVCHFLLQEIFPNQGTRVSCIHRQPGEPSLL